MGLSRSHEYIPRTFAAGQLSRALQAIQKELGDDEMGGISVARLLGDGTSIEEDTDLARLRTICEPWTDFVRLHAHFNRGKVFSDERVSVHFICRPDQLSIAVGAPEPTELTRVFAIVEQELELTKKPEELDDDPDVIDEILERLQRLEDAIRTVKKDLTFFLSYRFDGGVADGYGRAVEDYLVKLGVTVVTGKAFEPGKISDKIKKRIQPGISALVIIVESGVKSGFCRDELTRADTMNVPVIILQEDGTTFEPGIHADTERISFEKGHIGDGFHKLLEGVLSLRRRSIDEAEQP